MNKTINELKLALDMPFETFAQKGRFRDEINCILIEALEQPAREPDDLMQGRWIRFNEDDDTTQLLIELEIAMNGIECSAKSPAVIDVLRQAVDYFKIGKKYHVLPIDDIKPHKESEECSCNPAIEIYGNNKVFIHNSFDKREALEQPITRDWKDTINERIAKDDEFKKALEQPANGFDRKIVALVAQPLSDDEIAKLGWMNYMSFEEQIELVREIEQAHGIGVKEALEQPAQEPVSDDEIMNIWLFCEGKVAGLNETGFDCKFPVIFSRALLEFINAKQ